MMDAIKLVGVELEGGWKKNWLSEGLALTPDVSVTQPLMFCEKQKKVAPCRRCCQHWGELTSLPMPKSGIRQWMLDHYPTAVNESCGLHVHMSFHNTLFYSRCTDRAFYRYFLAEIKSWAEREKITNQEFWNRFNGKNRFCKGVFRPDKQLFMANKGPSGDETRRTQINFPWTLHKTVEVRLLPMFPEPELGVSGVEEILRITERWLAQPFKESGKGIVVKVKKDLGAEEVVYSTLSRTR